jgi:hypothetical protein
MKKFRTLFLVLVAVVIVGAVVGYGFITNWDFDSILNPFIKLFLSFVEFVTGYIANPVFTFPDVLYLASIVIAPLLALFFFISQSIRKDFVAALLGLASPLLLVYALIGLFIPYYPNIPDNLDNARPYFNIFLDDIQSDLQRAIIFGFVFGITILVTFVLILTLLFNKNYRGKRVIQTTRKVIVKKVESTQPLHVAPSLQATIPSQPLPPSSVGADLQLTELVKLVLAEELSGTRQPTYNSYPSAMDANLVRRIVAEELAKFQSHFITRAEAQTLVAQELATFKAQSKAK